eukprot:8061261-Alexandrium_andersonii.AAC.1
MPPAAVNLIQLSAANIMLRRAMVRCLMHVLRKWWPQAAALQFGMWHCKLRHWLFVVEGNICVRFALRSAQ